VPTEKDITAWLSQYPKPITLYGRRPRLPMVALILLACGIIWLTWTTPFPPSGKYDPEFTRWLFFTMSVVIAIATTLLLLPASGMLTLTATGFSFRFLFRSRFYRWSDASYFRVINDGQFAEAGPKYEYKKVWFSFTTDGVKSDDSNLPENYGLPPEALAALMRQWRERALSTT
jgi:hypothetical protein